MNRKNDMSVRFGKCRFFDRTEPAFAAVRKLHKKRSDLNKFTNKSGTSEEMVLVRLNHLRRVLQHSSVVEPNRFVSLGVPAVRLQLKLSTTSRPSIKSWLCRPLKRGISGRNPPLRSTATVPVTTNAIP
jgi:hypothetical protein